MLLLMDPFDTYSDGQKLTSGAWTTTAVTTSVAPAIGAYGRNGTNGMRAIPTFNGFTAAILRTLAPGDNTFIAGFALNVSTLPAATTYMSLISVCDNSNIQVQLTLRPDGLLEVFRGDFRSGTSLGVGTGVISTGSWFYVEIDTVIHNTTGSVQVFLDNVRVMSLSSKDTQATANQSWSNFAIGQYTAWFGVSTAMSGNYDYDDLYVMDGIDATATQGNPFNQALGDVNMSAIYPTADATYSQFSTHGSTSHYANVNEYPPDDDTTYNYDGTVGHRDSYSYVIPSSGGSIVAAGMMAYARKDDAGARQITEFVRAGGVDYDNATAMNLSNSYQFFNNIRALEPNTSTAWTSGTKEFGVKVSL